jgi:multiple sugar transport system permease protein
MTALPNRQGLTSRPGRGARPLLIHLLLATGSLVMLLPFYWMVSTALKTAQEASSPRPVWWPVIPQWHNFVEAWQQQPLWSAWFLNSALITVGTVLAELFLATLAAYAFSRIEFWGKEALFTLLLATMMIPGEVLLIPNYITVSNLGWIDTYQAQIIPWAVSVFAIFLLRQHFLQIPRELQEAAYLDGAGHVRFLSACVIPLSRPVLATVAVLKFVSSWNAFLWPYIVTNDPKMRTVQIGLNAFLTEAGTQYQLMMAAATVTLLPVLAIFLIAQKQFLESVAKSGLKG